MNVLAFDTCFSSCSVAVSAGREGGAPRIEAEHLDMNTGHAEALIPMIERVVARAGIAVSEIDRIVVTNGPGTFTGIRTGVAAARALALAAINGRAGLVAELLDLGADAPLGGRLGLALPKNGRVGTSCTKLGQSRAVVPK